MLAEKIHCLIWCSNRIPPPPPLTGHLSQMTNMNLHHLCHKVGDLTLCICVCDVCVFKMQRFAPLAAVTYITRKRRDIWPPISRRDCLSPARVSGIMQDHVDRVDWWEVICWPFQPQVVPVAPSSQVSQSQKQECGWIRLWNEMSYIQVHTRWLVH